MKRPEDSRLSKGVGLFDDRRGQFSEFSEDRVISYLSLQDIVTSMRTNQTWRRRMDDEMKRRLDCVTVYTWLASERSSEQSQGRMGHSALRTYSGGYDDKGNYVSFYPGDCHTTRRHPGCQKSVSHFHSWNQDSRKGAERIDIYGLNVDEINKTFHVMQDSEGNSSIPWSVRYNCSDVVLSLLEEGGVHKMVNPRPYGAKTIIGIGILSSVLFPVFINSLYDIFAIHFSNNRSRLMFKTMADDFFELFGVSLLVHQGGWRFTASDYRLLAHTVLDGVIGSLFSLPIMYAYTQFSLGKSRLPIAYTNPITFRDTLQSGMAGLMSPLFIYSCRNILKNFYPALAPRNFPVSIAPPFLHSQPKLTMILAYFFRHIIPKIKKDYPGITISNRDAAFVIGSITIAPLIFVLMSKYFYDTTTTPAQIHGLVSLTAGCQKEEQAKAALDIERSEAKQKPRRSITSARYKYNPAILATAGIGLFVIKTWINKGDHQVEVGSHDHLPPITLRIG